MLRRPDILVQRNNEQISIPLFLSWQEGDRHGSQKSVREDGLHYDKCHVHAIAHTPLYLLREDVAYILLSPELSPNSR